MSGSAGISGSSHFTLGGVVAGHLTNMKNTADPMATLYDVASGELIELDIPLYVWGWSSDGRSIFGYWPDGVMTVVDVTDPTAPVATQVNELTEISWAGWQPRP